MNNEQLQLLLDAAQKLQLDPSQLKVANPWTLNGSTAESIQNAVSDLNPQQAAIWRKEAGESLSLAGAAFEAGLAPLTASAHDELMELSPNYQAEYKQRRRAEEEQMMRNLHHGAEKLKEKRERELRWRGGVRPSIGFTGSTVASRLPTDHYKQPEE